MQRAERERALFMARGPVALAYSMDRRDEIAPRISQLPPESESHSRRAQCTGIARMRLYFVLKRNYSETSQHADEDSTAPLDLGWDKPVTRRNER